MKRNKNGTPYFRVKLLMIFGRMSLYLKFLNYVIFKIFESEEVRYWKGKTYVDWHATMEEGVWCWYYYAGKCSWNLGHLFGFCLGRFEYKEHDMLLQWLVGLPTVFSSRFWVQGVSWLKFWSKLMIVFISRGYRKFGKM